MKVWAYSLVSVFIVSLISLIGIATISISVERLKKILLLLVSFAVGALFGDAFVHLLPEAFERIDSKLVASLLIIAGVLLFFVLEKFICWRHCHIPTSKEHPHPVVFMNLIGDGLHNMIDGMIIGASYAASIPVGIATSLAVVLHEIPQEMGDFGILLHGGLTRKKALLFNYLSGTLAIAGCLIVLIIGSKVKNLALYLLPFTAGGFIYIAGSDLIPELNKEVELSRSILQLASLSLGIGVMVLLTLVG